MRLLFISFFIPLVILGCTFTGNPLDPTESVHKIDKTRESNDWNWGSWLVHVSADHSRVELVPTRFGDYHYCVTKFLELNPCDNCLTIGQPDIQPDDTIKLNVTLKHPFPNTPRYTGFDVRGVVYFPPTKIRPVMSGAGYASEIFYEDHHLPKPLFAPHMPLAYSRSADGGGEVLNAEGYSSYLIPGLVYSEKWPIFSYSPGIQGIEPTLQSTINPYLLFASETQRRMFYVNDTITRTYHIAIPEGEFTFGYAVDASWWPADNLPVQNPLMDFPVQANAEDPWEIELIQLLPMSEVNIDKEVFRIIIHHRGMYDHWTAQMFLWDFVDPELPNIYGASVISPTVGSALDENTYQFSYTLNGNWWGYYKYLYDGEFVPGDHFTIILVQGTPIDFDTTELTYPIAAEFSSLYFEV